MIDDDKKTGGFLLYFFDLKSLTHKRTYEILKNLYTCYISFDLVNYVNELAFKRKLSHLDRSPAFLTSDDFIRSNEIIKTKWPH